jgi:hypothetical protein
MEHNRSESTTSQATTPSVIDAELEQVQQQLISAWIHRDRSALERLLAQEWTVTHIDGRTSTRDQVLRDLDTGANRLLEGGVDDLRFRVYEDFAVVTGRTRARGEYQGHAYDVRLRFTDVLVRRDGRWQVVASHASRLADGEPPAAGSKNP